MRILITHLPATGESAYFRARHPESWWWTPDHDFLASILYTLQGANWQRAGGNGDKPKPVERPKDHRRIPKSAAELAARKKKLRRR